MARYSELDHSSKLPQYTDIIDHLGQVSGWRDRDSEGRTRHYLLALRGHGLLDRQTLLSAMRGRGHDEVALQRLDRLVDKTYREPGPYPEGAE